MEQTRCGRTNCGQSATRFCINCRTMLCRSHRIDDVKDNRASGAPEHLHVDALKYNLNPEYYRVYFCEIHNQEILTGRCINCGIFSCNMCHPEICPKGSGRHHDYDSIHDYVERRYKEEISELEKLLQKKNETFKLKLKEACRKLEKTDRDLQQMMEKVDEAVENQITTLRYYGKRFKEEIYKKKVELTKKICHQVEVLEQKEMESRNLLASIHACITDISGIKLVKTYNRIKEESEVLLRDRVQLSQPPVYELFLADAEWSRPLQLELRQTSPGVEEVCEECLCSKQKETEIKFLRMHKADEQLYTRVTYRPTGVQNTAAGSTVIAGDSYSTERVQGGESTDRKQHKSEVLQLLPYGDEVLLLTGEWDTNTYKYTVRGRDSGSIYNSYTDSETPYYYLYWNKLRAVNSSRQLLILQWETQTLRIVSLETGGAAEQRLDVAGIEGAYAILVPSDGGLIVSCEGPKGQRLLRYDPQTQQVLWESEPLSDQRLCVTEHQNYLYVLQQERPTHVWRLSLCDGLLVQKIQCSALPKNVWDISMRGDTFVVAGGSEGISYFQIKGVMY